MLLIEFKEKYSYVQKEIIFCNIWSFHKLKFETLWKQSQAYSCMQSEGYTLIPLLTQKGQLEINLLKQFTVTLQMVEKNHRIKVNMYWTVMLKSILKFWNR